MSTSNHTQAVEEEEDLELDSQSFLTWALRVEKREHVSYTAFVETFNFMDQTLSQKLYKSLIESTEIKQSRSAVLKRRYNTFLKLNFDDFWADRLVEQERKKTRLNCAVVASKTARLAQDASLYESSLGFRSYQGERTASGNKKAMGNTLTSGENNQIQEQPMDMKGAQSYKTAQSNTDDTYSEGHATCETKNLLADAAALPAATDDRQPKDGFHEPQILNDHLSQEVFPPQEQERDQGTLEGDEQGSKPSNADSQAMTCNGPMNELSTHLRPKRILGKRRRDLEEDGEGLIASSEKSQRLGDQNTKENIDPFQASPDDYYEDEEEDDVTTLVLEQQHRPLNIVFDYEAFNFACIIGGYDISTAFNSYYEDAITSPFDENNFQDFLATAGILFMSKEPTSMQRRHFGTDFEKLSEAIATMILPEEDKQAVANEEDIAVTFCQAARKVFRNAEREKGSEHARNKLKKLTEQEENSPLKRLYEHAVTLPKECSPVSEADQTSSFILGMLRPIFDRPDVSRLAHTATTPTSGSIFVRLCKSLSTSCKNPDLLVRFQECLDIGVAEVSLEPSALKDTGDLCRVALWSKRLVDQIVTRFENMDQLKLIFFQVIGQTCVFYTMMRADTVCVAMEFARLKIAYSISNVLTDFEDNARDWVLLCRNFDSLVTMLKSAKDRPLKTPSPAVFVGLSTPRSRHMKQDTHRRPSE
ncbi:MAG: hypothetical protein J3Q66DRAFT_442642 [Benniella sp.]|nr:MAG: hypothetical protein J3Q66DRAFT_442642 [Benniella sp.]